MAVLHTVSWIDGYQASSQERSQRPSDANGLPLADLGANAPSTPRESALRHLRSSHHDIADKSLDSTRFELNENSPLVLFSLSASHPAKEAALPISRSDAVVAGEIVDAKAFLSNDKTAVYSEFTVLVQQVIKGNSALYTGQTIIVERPGGRVRLKSGKELVRGGAYGRGMPSVGLHYVLFLSEDSQAEDFSLLTGYELRLGKVFPLDHTPEGDPPYLQFSEHEKYTGIDESRFFGELQTAFDYRP